MRKIAVLSLLIAFLFAISAGCASQPGSGQIAEAEISDYVRENLSDEFIPKDSLIEYAGGILDEYVHKDDIAEYVRQNLADDFIPVDGIEEHIKAAGAYVHIKEIDEYVRKNMSAEFVPVDEADEYIRRYTHTEPSAAQLPAQTKTPPSDSYEGGAERGMYVGSRNSDKYHEPGCQWAKKIKPSNEVWFDSREEAKEAGYVACKVCKP